MDNIKDVVNRVIAQMAQREVTGDDSIERLLGNLLSEPEKKHTKFIGFKNGHLSFYVDSSAWLFQMNIRKNKILEKLKEDKPDIKSLGFKIGKVT